MEDKNTQAQVQSFIDESLRAIKTGSNASKINEILNKIVKEGEEQ
jgi:hypothetical protein